MSVTAVASHAPAPSSRGLVSAALATGAAVLAGAVLGRRSLPGIAAGLAALAGAKWLSSARRPARLLRLEYSTPQIAFAPEVHSPEIKQGADWIDHHAVDFGHDVPDPIHARELLKEKVLPLLDNNGSPVQKLVQPHIDVAAQPVALASADESPHDTLIWEPTTSGAQSRSEAACETVWFGLHEPIIIGGHEPPFAVSPLSPNHGAPPHLTHGGVMSGSPLPPDTIIPPPGFPSKRRGTPFAVPLKTATVPLQEVVLPDVPASLELDFPSPSPGHAASSPLPGPATHLAAVPFMTSAAVAGASVISPKPHTSSLLPTPRRQGELPKHLKGEPAAEQLSSMAEPLIANILPEDTQAWLRELPILPETAPTAAAMPPRRHLEPLAPMVAFRPRPRRWPLLVLLTLLLGTFLFLAADGWQHGELLRKIKGMSSVHKAAVIKEAVSSPSAGAANPTSWSPVTAPLE